VYGKPLIKAGVKGLLDHWRKFRVCSTVISHTKCENPYQNSVPRVSRVVKDVFSSSCGEA